MRILRVNNQVLDIDDATAIGIDFQTYEISQPSQAKINVSNNFSLPKTNKNLEIIGFLGGGQQINDSFYSSYTVDYFVNNIQFIENANLRVESIDDRINCFVFDKKTFWDEIKTVLWSDFSVNYYNYIVANGAPDTNNRLTISYSDWIDLFLQPDGYYGFKLPYLKGNETEGLLQMDLTGIDSNNDYVLGGHFVLMLKPFFEYLESEYSVDFNINSSFTGNLFNDSVFLKMGFIFRNIIVNSNTVPSTPEFFFRSWLFDPDITYLNTFEADETPDKSLYDLIQSILKIFNVILIRESDTEFSLRRFDDLETNATVQDFSDNITDKIKFIPKVDDTAQNNYITFTDHPENGDKNTNRRTLTCNNESLDKENTLLDINGYIPNLIKETGLSIDPLFYGEKNSFNNFKFVVLSDTTLTESITIRHYDLLAGILTTNKTGLQYAQIYSLAAEYLLYDNAITYPKVYEIEKWMNALDILDFNFYKLYFIRQLGGSFFVNKIKGFNPDKSKQPTTLEIIKVSDRTPAGIISDVNIFTDGFESAFVDGLDNNFITN